MLWTDQVFAYCERGSDPAFWAEPLNAISNAAFLIVAAAALAVWLRQPAGRRDRASLALIGLVTAIGIGSFLFHTFATRWARLADTAPISIFMIAYLVFALRNFLALSWAAVLVASLAFLAAAAAIGGASCGGRPCANGSLGYLPALAALAIVGTAAASIGNRVSRRLLVASALLALSLAARTLDLATCPLVLVPPDWKIGTHALWHVLNALVLHHLLSAAVIAGNNGK